MLDFDKLRRQNAQRMAEMKRAPAKPAPLTLKERFQHMADYHWDDLSSWARGFVESNIEYQRLNPDAPGTTRILEKLKELEDEHCGQFCHALNKARNENG